MTTVKKFRTDSEKIQIVETIMNSTIGTKKMCIKLGIRPNQFYGWRDKFVSSTPNPRKRVFEQEKNVSDFSVFKKEYKEEIEKTINQMFNEWKEKDTINRIKSKITSPTVIEEMSKSIGLPIENVQLFLQRKYNQIPYHYVDKMCKFLGFTW